ncbi:MAG: dihydroxy-acid dehydratase domain-containing protein [Verrucomicrobiia bacterium]
MPPLNELLDFSDDALYTLRTHAAGPSGALPLEADQLRGMSSGDLFGWTQNAGMGWDPKLLLGKQFLILSTQGGLRAPDGSPIALGYHTGHWEIGLLVEEAARSFSDSGAIPFAAYCSDPCDGRTNGTLGMLDSLPYRNDAAIVFRRQIRSLPTRRGVLGIATCDKGLPAMLMAEALGLTLPHAALSPSGAPIWKDMARRSAQALLGLETAGLTTRDILTDDSIHNAMVVHAAIGGSTNLVLHIPAIAHAAGLRQPTVEDWTRINRSVPRLVDSLPNGPKHFATVQVFLAGGAPEVMLHLRKLGLLKLNALTVTGRTLGENLDWWESSEQRQRLKEKLRKLDGIDPDEVIMSPEQARERGLASTVTFLQGNLAPEGALVKSTAIAPDRIGDDGFYRHEGPACVMTSEKNAIEAIKAGTVQPGDTLVLMGIGPGCGMPETYQITSALKYVKGGDQIALITDGRFSGVSTGACIGHISPEAWADGPIGRIRNGDTIRIEIDTRKLEGSINVITEDDSAFDNRPRHPELIADPNVPTDTRLWATLQNASGGSWAGCIYDADRIAELIEKGLQAEQGETRE